MRSRAHLRFCAAAAGLALFAGTALAQSPGQPSSEAGHALARKLCSTCHMTESAIAAPVTVGIPSLAAIANKAGQRREAIEATLVAPPHPMPDVQLTRGEIADLVTYLDTLRKDRAGPSWAPSPEPGPGRLKLPGQG